MKMLHDSEGHGSTETDPQVNDASRRSFLKRSALGTVPALLGVAGLAQAGEKKKPIATGGPSLVMTDAVRASIPSLYPGWNARNFREIQADENSHAAELLTVLGTDARPKPTFQGLVSSNIQQFVAMSQMFENTGVGAYLQAGYFIKDKTYGFVANQIALVEAYHSGYLNTLANSPIVPNGNHYANGLSVAQIVAAVGPLIVSLNGGPPAGYQDVQSDANDINILNFALLLEFLEQEFYNINVPRFFG